MNKFYGLNKNQYSDLNVTKNTGHITDANSYIDANFGD